MNRTVNNIVAIVAVGTPLLVLVIILVLLGYSAALKDECLRYGYPQAKVSIFLNRYCIRREDQTDVVTRIEELRK